MIIERMAKGIDGSDGA
jgi:hypothetical protein